MMSWKARCVGINRNSSPGSPMSIIGGKKVASRKAAKREEIFEPDDPAAAPLSSGAEESSDDEDGPRRGDIQSTTFETKDEPSESRTGGRTTRGSKEMSKHKRNAQDPKRTQESDPDNISDPVSKRPKVAVSKRIGNHHHIDPFARKKTATKYGSKGNQTNGKGKPSTRREAEASSSESSTTLQKTKKTLDIGQDYPEGLAATPSPTKPLLEAPLVAETTLRKKTKLLEDVGGVESPLGKEKTLEIPPDDGRLDSSPTRPSRKDKASRKGLARPPTKKKLTGKTELPKLSPPKFDIPSLDFDDGAFSFDLDQLDDLQSPVAKREHDRSPSPDRGPTCPMCGESVEQDFLDNFSKKRYMSITLQQKVCHAHKVKTAWELWSDKGYPNIDWARLDKRIARHYDFLEDIVEGGSSHYSSIYAKQIKGGSNRTLIKMTENMTPGYYGTRGLRVMTEKLIDHFSALLRRVATRDRLVSARGQTTFVQCVLVPELGVRLIMDDIHVDEREARGIMKESIPVGELLNEEEADVVPFEEESDGDSSSLSSIKGEDDESDSM